MNGVTSLLPYALFYLFVSLVPALVLLVRGRGWRPRFFAVTFFLAWTGGGWAIMLWIAIQERDGQWKMNQALPPYNSKQSGRDQSGHNRRKS